MENSINLQSKTHGIYFAINKERSDIKTELDYAMCGARVVVQR